MRYTYNTAWLSQYVIAVRVQTRSIAVVILTVLLLLLVSDHIRANWRPRSARCVARSPRTAAVAHMASSLERLAADRSRNKDGGWSIHIELFNITNKRSTHWIHCLLRVPRQTEPLRLFTEVQIISSYFKSNSIAVDFSEKAGTSLS